MGLVLLPLAVIALFAGIFLSVVATSHRSERSRRFAAAALVAGWLLLAAAIVHEGTSRGHFPLTNMPEYLLGLAWLVLGVHLLVSFRFRVEAMALVLPPLSAALSLIALVLPARAVAVPAEQQRAWFIFHTTVSTVGMAALGVAFATAVMYLVQDRALKTKSRLRLLERLPSLEVCDRIGYHALLWGFPLLTLGIATGLVWSYHVHGSLWTQGAKQTFSVLAWAVFALLLYARLVRGFRGRKSAYVTIAGFALGLLVVLGMVR